MAIAKKEVSYCQELDDVLSLVVNLVSKVKSGEGAAAIVLGSGPDLVKALEGIDQVKVEAQDAEALDNTVALRLGELKRLLLPSLP